MEEILTGVGGRPKNSDVRPREYLKIDEVWSVVQAARRRKGGRNNTRDAALIEVIYRHGLRVSEARLLTWDDVSLTYGTIIIKRLKSGKPGIHRLAVEEIKTLKRLQTKYPGSRFLFTAEGGGPIDRRSMHDIISRAGTIAGIPFPIHAHMLRHSKGYNLVNEHRADIRVIAGYLGHRSMHSTMRYTELDESVYKGLSEDRHG